MRSYPVNLNPDPDLPRGLFDPRWQDPAIASRVAFTVYRRLSFDEAPLRLVVDGLPEQKAMVTDARVFPLVDVHEHDGAKFKGGSFGELHRRYSFGGRRPTVNFHAQAVCFGVDDKGRFYLRSKVGRFDGGWGNDAALVVKLHAGDELVGAVYWAGELDPPKDVHVHLLGKDPVVAARFAELTEARVAFTGRHHGG